MVAHTRLDCVTGSAALMRQAVLQAHHHARHRSAFGGGLRAAVFGVNDGQVANVSLVLGGAGAGAASGSVLTAGVADELLRAG